jgi:hypothetical protein
MKYKEIYDVVYGNSGKTFVITYHDGRKENKRLFISTNDCVCEFHKHSNRKGTEICYHEINNVALKSKQKSEIVVCRDNLQKVVKYLSISGLWQHHLECAKLFLSMTDEELLSYKNYDKYNTLVQNGNRWFGFDCFLNLFGKCIKCANFESYEREYLKTRLSSALSNKDNISYRWRKGYDNSIEIRFDEDCAKGWYSEEYKGCVNGHYYFLLDNCHVLFGEDD